MPKIRDIVSKDIVLKLEALKKRLKAREKRQQEKEQRGGNEAN